MSRWKAFYKLLSGTVCFLRQECVSSPPRECHLSWGRVDGDGSSVTAWSLMNWGGQERQRRLETSSDWVWEPTPNHTLIFLGQRFSTVLQSVTVRPTQQHGLFQRFGRLLCNLVLTYCATWLASLSAQESNRKTESNSCSVLHTWPINLVLILWS